MFIKTNNGVVDGELGRLCELFDLLDRKLIEINGLIQYSSDPDSDGLCDRGEYFIGIGFVAAQQYLIDTLLCVGLKKHEAYKLGPVHSSGATYVSLINSAANWWKHEAEWCNQGKVPQNGESTFARVTGIAVTPGYELSNVLTAISMSGKISMYSLFPYLVEWRDSVDAKRERQ